MARITYIEPVQSVSGKLFQKSNIIFMRRKAATSNDAVPNFTHSVRKRSTMPSESELQHRTKFGTIAKAVSTRLQNPTEMAKDQVAFKAQSAYKTLRQYVWHQVSDSIE